MGVKELIAEMVSRKVVVRQQHGTVLEWTPLASCLCDVLIRFEDGSECWYASHELKPTNSKPLLQRETVRRMADMEALSSLRAIRGELIEDINKAWPGMEFGKAHLGNALNQAIQEITLRYQEESTTRENPLRIGTKRIKLSGVEYPFIAVSDHWRPALLHENRLVWIHHYRAIEGLRRGIFKVYYATMKVPYNRLPWTVDNACFGDGPNGREFNSLKEAIDVAMIIAENRGQLIEISKSSAAANLGRLGGMVRSDKKSKAVKENGKKGGRPKSTMSMSPDLSLFEE